MQKSVVITGACFILLAIILGAFGAHALKAVLTEEKLISFETGVRYQLIQGLALLILGTNAVKMNFEMKWINRLLIVGTILFSFSIYFLALSDILGVRLKWLGPITPLGGSLMIIGWAIFIAKMIKRKDSN